MRVTPGPHNNEATVEYKSKVYHKKILETRGRSGLAFLGSFSHGSQGLMLKHSTRKYKGPLYQQRRHKKSTI